MNIEMHNEFVEDYAGQIALECANLEHMLTVGLEDYDTSSKIIGTSWYSVGLENHDDDKEKDGANKRNILLRIIDKIVGFIKMVGKKIVEWLRACKAAILKFFGQDHIDPAQVSERLNDLVDGLSKEDVDALIAGLSPESKASMAELVNKDYGDGFYALYGEYKTIASKSENLGKFAENHKFFAEFKEKSDALKALSKEKDFHQNAETILKEFLLSQSNSERVKGVTSIFNEIAGIHDTTVGKLEHLLSKVPDDNLEALEGDNVDVKRREALKLIADVIKIDGEIVLKVNHHMQAVSMLMSFVVKYRTKRLVGIRM